MASMPIVVDRAEKFEKVVSILNRHARRPSGLIPILQAIQHEYQYLPEEVLTYVAPRWMFLRRVSSASPLLCALCAGAEGKARHPHLRRNGMPRQAVPSGSECAAPKARHD